MFLKYYILKTFCKFLNNLIDKIFSAHLGGSLWFCSVITRFIEIRRCPHESRMECSWPAIIKFFTFKVENIVFADIFVFLLTNDMSQDDSSSLQSLVFPSSSISCFKSVLKQFLGAFLCPVM